MGSGNFLGTGHPIANYRDTLRSFVLTLSSLFRPHHSTTYIDAVYCYQPSNVVCRSVCLLYYSPAKTVERIEMPFWLRTWVGPRDHVLDEVQITPNGNGHFGERGGTM